MDSEDLCTKGKHLERAVVLALGLVLTCVLQPLGVLRASVQSNCQSFPETQQTVCGRFLQYWQQSGGLAQQGYPISREFTEVSDLNGKTYTVWYFERAVFEMHPELQPPYDVLLSQLGTFHFKSKYPAGDPNGSTPVIPALPAPRQPSQSSPAGSFQKWTSQQVVAVYKAAGLEIANTRPVTDKDYGPAPQTAVEGTRFFIASLCSDCGGCIF